MSVPPVPHADHDRAAPRPRSPWLTVGICFLVAVLEGFDIQALGVAAPRLAPELSLDPAQMGWLFAIGSIGILFGAAIGGRAADRIGRKPVFATSVAIFGAFTVAMTGTKSFEGLLVLRGIAGLGFGAALPNMMAVAIDIAPTSRRAFTAAAMFCGLPLGGAAAALVTQLLPPDADWRVIFYMGGVLPLLLVPAILFYMSETYRPVVRDGARERPPALLHSLLGEYRATSTLLIWVVLLPTMLMLYLLLNWLPTLVSEQGLPRSVAPLAAMFFNLGGAMGGLMLAPLVDRFGFRWPVTFAFTALFAVLVALATASSTLAILALSGLGGFLLLGANYAFYGVAAAYYPAHIRGTGSGAAVAVGRFGSVVGPLFAGLLMGQGRAVSDILSWLAPCAAIAALAVLALSFVRSSSVTGAAENR